MQPTLNPRAEQKDWIFVSRWLGIDYKIARGDIVCLSSPCNPKETLVKRVIGLEGDIIRTLSYGKTFVSIPKGHMWVEGDNNKQSFDSNRFGPVPVGLLVGKATHIFWPSSRFTVLDHMSPPTRLPMNKSV